MTTSTRSSTRTWWSSSAPSTLRVTVSWRCPPAPAKPLRSSPSSPATSSPSPIPRSSSSTARAQSTRWRRRSPSSASSTTTSSSTSVLLLGSSPSGCPPGRISASIREFLRRRIATLWMLAAESWPPLGSVRSPRRTPLCRLVSSSSSMRGRGRPQFCLPGFTLCRFGCFFPDREMF